MRWEQPAICMLVFPHQDSNNGRDRAQSPQTLGHWWKPSARRCTCSSPMWALLNSWMASCTSSGGMLSWLSTALASCRLGSRVSGTTAVAPACTQIAHVRETRSQLRLTWRAYHSCDGDSGAVTRWRVHASAAAVSCLCPLKSESGTQQPSATRQWVGHHALVFSPFLG